jgi:hypothetical protein
MTKGLRQAVYLLAECHVLRWRVPPSWKYEVIFDYS